MSSDKNLPRFGVCSNVANCGSAAACKPLAWYLGAGEYCPECGEALVLRELSFRQPAVSSENLPSAAADRVETVLELPARRDDKRRLGLRSSPQRWWTVAAGTLVAAGVYAWHGYVTSARVPGDVVRTMSSPQRTSFRDRVSGSIRGLSARGEPAGSSAARAADVSAGPAAPPRVETSACFRESSAIKGEDLYRACVRVRVKLHVLIVSATSEPDIERCKLEDGLAEIRQAVGAAQLKMTSANSFIHESVATFADLKRSAVDDRVRWFARQYYDRYARLAATSEGVRTLQNL